VELGIWAEAADRERLVGELSSTGRVEDLRARFRRKSGEIGIGLMSARVLAIAGERVILSLTRDITAEVELEEKYRQAQKMEAVGRRPRGGCDFQPADLLSYAEMLGQTLAPEDERRYMVEEILHAGRRAANLTRQILAFSRKQVLDMGALDLNRLVGEFQRMIARLLRENIEVQLELAPDLPRVRADRAQLEQVLMNLAVNAGDAMPDGGRLTIQTYAGQDPDDPAAEPSGLASACGLGMSADTLSHLGASHQRARQGQARTGTVFGIVQRTGGSRWPAPQAGDQPGSTCPWPRERSARGSGLTSHAVWKARKPCWS
jgi:signal transduction histidine kinase